MDTHITKICKTAFFFHLYNIRRIWKFVSLDCTDILVNAFVTSRLDYYNSLLYGLPNNLLRKLQRVQNAAAGQADLQCWPLRSHHSHLI